MCIEYYKIGYDVKMIEFSWFNNRITISIFINLLFIIYEYNNFQWINLFEKLVRALFHDYTFMFTHSLNYHVSDQLLTFSVNTRVN